MQTALLRIIACVAAFLHPNGAAAASWWPDEAKLSKAKASHGAEQAEEYDELPEGFHSDVDSISVAVGAHHTCALEYRPGAAFGGPAKCWGMNSWGQASPPPGLFMQLSAGQRHTCGVRVDQTIACWGISSWAPEGLWQQVSAGAHHTCALGTDGSANCWGSDVSGCTRPPAGVKFVQLTCGSDVTCGIRTNGLAICWGSDFRGQASPPAGVRFRQLSASSTQHVCGVTLEGDVVCWGRSMAGEAQGRKGPFRQVSCGQWRTCTIREPPTAADDSDGAAAASGAVLEGEHEEQQQPQQPPLLECWGVVSRQLRVTEEEAREAYEEISSSDYHMCAVTAAGELRCWGKEADYRPADVPDGFEVA